MTVTYVHGHVVPGDIRDLCAQLAVGWLEHQNAGGGTRGGAKSVRLDDGAESYTDEAAAQISTLEIPEATRRWLRARFAGHGATTVGTA